MKTNLVIPGEPAKTLRVQDRNITRAEIDEIVALIRTFRESVGNNVDIALDLNFNLTMDGCIALARALEQYDLMWLEIDNYDVDALLTIKHSINIPVCSGENLYLMRGYNPFLECHAMDFCMLDVPWNGFTEGRKIAALANMYDINIAPHNYYSHLSTFMSAHIAASIPNFKIMEIDVDAPPWRDDFFTDIPQIENGHMLLPQKAGVGTSLNEAEMQKHPWSQNKSSKSNQARM